MMGLFEYDIIYMFADVYAGHVARLIPCGFAGHSVGDMLSVDYKIVKRDVAHGACLVISRDD